MKWIIQSQNFTYNVLILYYIILNLVITTPATSQLLPPPTPCWRTHPPFCNKETNSLYFQFLVLFEWKTYSSYYTKCISGIVYKREVETRKYSTETGQQPNRCPL